MVWQLGTSSLGFIQACEFKKQKNTKPEMLIFGNVSVKNSGNFFFFQSRVNLSFNGVEKS